MANGVQAAGDEAMREEKVALLTSCRYDPPRSFLLASAGRMIDPGVITALRLIYLERSELEASGNNWNSVGPTR